MLKTVSGPMPTTLAVSYTHLDGVETAVRLIGAERDRGAVVIMASHDLAATGQIADRALVLRRGRKVYEGPVDGDLAALYQQAVRGALAS